MNPNLSDWDDDLQPEPEEAYQNLRGNQDCLLLRNMYLHVRQRVRLRN
ncbi:hypothetical protein [Nostoc sp. C057]|nr:hypothetical protein [Nostoc sp. C057]